MTSKYSQIKITFCMMCFCAVLLWSSCSDNSGLVNSYTATIEMTPSELEGPTQTVIPTIVNTASATIIPTATRTSTPTPTPTQSLPEFSFKIAYLRDDTSITNDKSNARIVQLLYPEQISSEIYTYPPLSVYGFDFSWSNNGQWLAFRRDEDRKFFITILDTITLESRDYLIPIQEPGSKQTKTELCWSLDDRWIAFTISDLDNFRRIKTYVLDTTDGQSWLLGEGVQFVSWSPKIASQYFYIQHTYLGPVKPEDPNEGPITVHLGELGAAEPLVSIIDMGDLTPTMWFAVAPDGETAVAGNAILIDFQRTEWEWITSYSTHVSPRMWSPSGEWLVFLSNKDPLLWNMALMERVSEPIPQESFFLYLLGWMREPEMLFYQDGLNIMLVDPLQPGKPELVLKLPASDLEEQGFIYPVKFWVSSE